MFQRISKYRIMWIMVMFDLPTFTAEDRKNYRLFHNFLESAGFDMFQFSIYIRNCSSVENAQVHIKRIQSNLPPAGKVGIMTITDKQFADIQLFYGGFNEKMPQPTPQLMMF